jgi:hypothetical protein
LNAKQKKRSRAFISDVAADIEKDRPVTLKKFALIYGMST